MTNRLADTLSPYLRAHADNPVDWYPWGEEAFAESRRREVPVMVSIGYSTCHWCHVMARESFSDPETAAQLNDGFVAIKIDREEHPDVDAAFLAAAAAFTRNLGWPLTVFTTPEGRAFYAGTYWPETPRGGMPAFREVLTAVQEAWTLRRAQVLESADAVADALRAASVSHPSPLPDASALRAAAEGIASREDPLFGGFGGAPKFPVAPTLRFLQTVGRSDVVERALVAMAGSELRDADGGFFRYATGRDWTVPHYERMLTDNAQLLDVALAAGQADVARGIAAFLLTTLRRGTGGFAAAQDSESTIDGQRNEGGYYRRSPDERAGLEPPAVDGKVLTGWNGLAIGALARAGAALGQADWVGAAEDAARTVLAVNRDADGHLVRSSLDGIASAAVATRADIGLLADGLLALAAATGDAHWATEGLAVLASDVRPDPVLDARGIHTAGDESDGDLPSGTAALAGAHLAAWMLGAGDEHRQAASDLIGQVAARALAEPFGYGATLRVAVGLAQGPRQIVVVTDDRDGALAAAARGADADLAVVVTPEQARAFTDVGFALFDGKGSGTGPEAAYDCRAFVCRLPVSDPAELPRAR